MKQEDHPPMTQRRRARRRTLVETFAFFVVVPRKGAHRLPVYDLSEDGIGFDLDIEGELPETFPVQVGEELDLRFYLNQSLYLPLKIKVARTEEKNQIRRIGAVFCDEKSPGRQACLGMLQMIDQLLDIAQIDSTPNL